MGTRLTVLRLSLGILSLCLLPCALCWAPETQTAPYDPPGSATKPAPQLVPDFGKVPLQFIPNQGQKDGRVAYYVTGRDKTIYFTAEGLTYVLEAQRGKAIPKDALGTTEEKHSDRWVVRLDFVKPDAKVKPVGEETSGTVFSYFKGRPKEWKTGIAASSKIVYRDVWPGIDLRYSGSYNAMKYEFLVHPGADPGRIRMAYRGAQEVVLTTDGRLEAKTPAGDLRDDRPLAYQDVKGVRRTVAVAYDLEADTYGFWLGDYDRTLPLVLDPSVLVYCGYIGGNSTDQAHGIAVDAAGNAYIAGTTRSNESSFPVTVGPDLTYNAAGDPFLHPSDAFVAKVNPAGTALEYCGYIGGSERDEAGSIAVDAMGNAYVTGYTLSSEADFPVVTGPDLTYHGGGDAWVAKVDPTGTALLYCGYIGGTASDGAGRIAVDGAGQAYIAGRTESTQSTFPVVVGPDLTYNDAGYAYDVGDVFVAKVNASGTALAYCGYIGGGHADSYSGIAVDGSGCAYVTGNTESDVSTFPVKVGPSLVPAHGFVAKVSPTGETLEYCGFLGHDCYAAAVDAAGSAYAAGAGFVAKVRPDGTGFVYSTLIGTGVAHALGIAVDAAGSAYITGGVGQGGGGLPVTLGPDLTPNGSDDAFVAKLNSSGTAFEYCGYIGGSSKDSGEAIAVDGSGNAFVAGTTGSPTGPPSYFPATVGPDLTHHGGFNSEDGFVAKVPPSPVAPALPVLAAIVPDNCLKGATQVTIALEGANFAEGAIMKWCREDGYVLADFPTTFIDSTKLQVSIDSYFLGFPAVRNVKVVTTDGEVTGPITFMINNPVPTLASMSPTAVTGGGPDFRMTLTGTNFNGFVRWNGVEMAYCGGYGTDMWADVPSSQIATGGSVEITVYNPPPGGGASNPLSLTVSTFSLNPSPAAATVDAGQSASFPIQLTPEFGSFDAEVSFLNGSLPKDCTASFSPASVTPGASVVSTTMTIRTQARSSAAQLAGPIDLAPLGLALLFAGFLALYLFPSRLLPSETPRRRWVMAAALVGAFIALGSCGSGGGGGGGEPPPPKGTPAGTYQISVAGRSGSMTVSTTVSLTVR